jgi:hypothetical protein
MFHELQAAIQMILKTGFDAPYFSMPGEVDLISKMNIHLGTLPPKQAGSYSKNEYPFCVINIMNGEDECNKTSFINSSIHFGAYSGDDDHDKESYLNGFHEIQNITQRARLTLLKVQELELKYKLEKLSWMIGDENGFHSHPLYQSLIMTAWSVPLINRELNKDELDNIL